MNICFRSRALVGVAAILGACFLYPIAFSYADQTQEQLVSVTKAEIETASKRRVVFAHQSVGENILDGVKELAKKNGVSINIIESRHAEGSEPGIYHFKVGQNGDPAGKIGDYLNTLKSAPFGQADVALVKLCYVDFDRQSDAAAIAKNYISAINKLQASYPSTRFVAVTAPLTAIPGGPKAWVKKMIGRGPNDIADNAKRKEFNDTLRREFDNSHLFDIAKLEAEAATTDDGKPIEVMRQDLTNDGGHLNSTGQQLVGAAFIKVLAAE